MSRPKVKRCPRCGRVKPTGAFYRRRRGRRLSPYCQPCTRAASRLARQHRRQDPAAAEQLRGADRVRQRRHRTPGRPRPERWRRRMSRHASVANRVVAGARGGRAGAAAAVPFLVLDLGRGCDPHQARCRCCGWRSRWRTTAAQARAEHARHQSAAHGRGGLARRGHRGLMRWP